MNADNKASNDQSITEVTSVWYDDDLSDIASGVNEAGTRQNVAVQHICGKDHASNP